MTVAEMREQAQQSAARWGGPQGPARVQPRRRRTAAGRQGPHTSFRRQLALGLAPPRPTTTGHRKERGDVAHDVWDAKPESTELAGIRY